MWVRIPTIKEQNGVHICNQKDVVDAIYQDENCHVSNIFRERHYLSHTGRRRLGE